MTYTVEDLAIEQDQLRLPRFDYDIAWRLGSMIRERAAAMKAPVIVTVSHGPDLVFLSLLPGATSDNIAWAARKRAVAWRFHRSSLAMRLEAERDGIDFNKRYRLPEADYVASGGGVPLILKGGTIIGTAAVSGLPNVEDHKLIVEALRALTGEG